MAALLRKVDCVLCRELGRRTGRRSSPMEQTLQPKRIPGKRWGNKKRVPMSKSMKDNFLDRLSLAGVAL